MPHRNKTSGPGRRSFLFSSLRATALITLMPSLVRAQCLSTCNQESECIPENLQKMVCNFRELQNKQADLLKCQKGKLSEQQHDTLRGWAREIVISQLSDLNASFSQENEFDTLVQLLQQELKKQNIYFISASSPMREDITGMITFIGAFKTKSQVFSLSTDGMAESEENPVTIAPYVISDLWVTPTPSFSSEGITMTSDDSEESVHDVLIIQENIQNAITNAEYPISERAYTETVLANEAGNRGFYRIIDPEYAHGSIRMQDQDIPLRAIGEFYSDYMTFSHMLHLLDSGEDFSEDEISYMFQKEVLRLLGIFMEIQRENPDVPKNYHLTAPLFFQIFRKFLLEDGSHNVFSMMNTSEHRANTLAQNPNEIFDMIRNQGKTRKAITFFLENLKPTLDALIQEAKQEIVSGKISKEDKGGDKWGSGTCSSSIPI